MVAREYTETTTSYGDQLYSYKKIIPLKKIWELDKLYLHNRRYKNHIKMGGKAEISSHQKLPCDGIP